MTVNYTVKADVIDIATDSPQKGDIFLVDTNVWYWLTYPPASLSLTAYQSNYSNYITDTFTAGATLCCSGLSLAELAHIIEREEKRLSSYRSSSNNKEYRHNYPSERTKVVSRVKAAWNRVKNIYALQISVELDENTVDNALTQFSTQCLDGYDLFILESMKQESVNKIITDDGDYVTVPGIQVFTANPGAIAAARNQGKLITR
ncbi:MAG: PIN domain-containing protein [Nostoc sp.]|uniref:PIN domain-containing protein n=1 Tax=Nostoc sp. TaxID=1180 RepID=UPI002FF8AB70